MTAPMQPHPGAPPPIPPLFNPFDPRPNDDEPEVAAIRMRRLSRLLSQATFSKFSPNWRRLVIEEYTKARQVMAQVAQMQAQAQQGAPKPAQPSAHHPQGAPHP